MFPLQFYSFIFGSYNFLFLKLWSVKEENVYLNKLCNVKSPISRMPFCSDISLLSCMVPLDIKDKKNKKKKKDESLMTVQTVDVFEKEKNKFLI